MFDRRLCPALYLLLSCACSATHSTQAPQSPVPADEPDGGPELEPTPSAGPSDASASGSPGRQPDGGSQRPVERDPGAVGRPASGGDGGASAVDADPEPSAYCLEDVAVSDEAGPFAFEPRTVDSVKLWVPVVPADCSVPVIHHANGTGANCLTYRRVLEHLASYGFLTVCYESANTGSGVSSSEAIKLAFELYPRLAHHRIGTTGHHAGGQAAFLALQQAEQTWGDGYRYAGLAVEPASGFGSQPPGLTWPEAYAMIRSPMFMFSGGADSLVSQNWVQSSYDALDDSIEAYHWSAVDATHIPVPQAEMIEVAVPWFRWKLLDDRAACGRFRALLDSDRWISVAEQNPLDC